MNYCLAVMLPRAAVGMGQIIFCAKAGVPMSQRMLYHAPPALAHLACSHFASKLKIAKINQALKLTFFSLIFGLIFSLTCLVHIT